MKASDVSLKQWLLLHLNGEDLDSIDMVGLSALDVTDATGARKTLADIVDSTTFEHIRIRLKGRHPCAEGIGKLIQEYYIEVKLFIYQYKVNKQFLTFIIKGDYGQLLMVAAFMETAHILNVTVTASKEQQKYDSSLE